MAQSQRYCLWLFQYTKVNMHMCTWTIHMENTYTYMKDRETKIERQSQKNRWMRDKKRVNTTRTLCPLHNQAICCRTYSHFSPTHNKHRSSRQEFRIEHVATLSYDICYMRILCQRITLTPLNSSPRHKPYTYARCQYQQERSDTIRYMATNIFHFFPVL